MCVSDRREVTTPQARTATSHVVSQHHDAVLQRRRRQSSKLEREQVYMIVPDRRCVVLAGTALVPRTIYKGAPCSDQPPREH